jgi:tRNA-Thr(GGU) m(6)t(6)A37 methyltransferase TsaA
MRQATYELTPIGTVESPLADPAAAPKQGQEGVLVLTWLHLARRDVLRVHPRDDPANPLQGVFATRSADRPNPIGLHEVEVLAVEGPALQVRGLEAVDGTPVLDVKPLLRRGRVPA